MDYLVALEQIMPYYFFVLDTFTTESDAVKYAKTYAYLNGYVQLAERRWRSAQGDNQKLIIFTGDNPLN